MKIYKGSRYKIPRIMVYKRYNVHSRTTQGIIKREEVDRYKERKTTWRFAIAPNKFLPCLPRLP